jgi:hypothetical protein
LRAIATGRQESNLAGTDPDPNQWTKPSDRFTLGR